MAGTARRQGCSSVIEHAADRYMRARTRAEAVALCWTTLKLAQVSLPARTCPHTVLLCELAPKRSSTAHPDLRLHHVCGRRLSKAAVKAAFNGCRKAARGSSVATQGSSRRRPWCHRDVPPLAGEGLARGPDGRGSSSLVLCAAWPVHPDILPSWGGFGAPVSPLGCVCSVIRKIARERGSPRAGPRLPRPHALNGVAFPTPVLTTRRERHRVDTLPLYHSTPYYFGAVPYCDRD